jgi:hypothetical protein
MYFFSFRYHYVGGRGRGVTKFAKETLGDEIITRNVPSEG